MQKETEIVRFECKKRQKIKEKIEDRKRQKSKRNFSRKETKMSMKEQKIFSKPAEADFFPFKLKDLQLQVFPPQSTQKVIKYSNIPDKITKKILFSSFSFEKCFVINLSFEIKVQIHNF